MVFEIPRGTQAKMEINTKEFLNPIKQDLNKDGSLRFIGIPYPFNYGAFPQTWESPDIKGLPEVIKGEEKPTYGDRDPLDVVDIGQRVARTGEVRAVKILGVWGMIDSSETDWKILAIDLEDDRAAQLNDINDVENLQSAREDRDRALHFLKYYKTYDGKGANYFAFEGQLKDKQYAIARINECHEQWKQLLTDRKYASEYSTVHTTELKALPDHLPISLEEVKQRVAL